MCAASRAWLRWIADPVLAKVCGGVALFESCYAFGLWKRFESSGDSAILKTAIRAGILAVELTPIDHPMLAGRASILGGLFQRTGDPADLEIAIGYQRVALEAVPLDDPRHAIFIASLADCLRLRYEITGNAADLDAAIDAGVQAVEEAPSGDPVHAMGASALGGSLLRRFERTGDATDLDRAIATAQRAVSSAPSNTPVLLSNLGAALRSRFELMRDSRDLAAAIDAGRRAVAAAPPRHRELAMYLSNLGVSLQMRFEHAGDPDDLDDAVDVARRAVAAAPPGHPELVRCLSNLGVSLQMRFEHAGDPDDLDAAIDAGKRSVTLTQSNHPYYALRLSNLADHLRRRFEHSGDTADLDAAIDTGKHAVTLYPPGHPDLAISLSSMGRAVHQRFKLTGNPADLDAALGFLHQASLATVGSTRTRFLAAQEWAILAADAGRMHEAADGYATAVGLLPEVAWHGLDRATRQEQLAQWAGLAINAAGCAVVDGCPVKAVELLEQGRSLLWAQALSLRSDLARLSEKAPELATRLDGIRRILDTPVSNSLHSRPEDAADLRRRKAREWDRALAQVRSLNGFERFLTATPYKELAMAAIDGPVVILNASRYGCHALVVDADHDQPGVIDLPDMSLEVTIEHANTMLRVASAGAYQNMSIQDLEKDRRAMLGVLDWLWDVAAQPVLASLGHTTPPRSGTPWPRVWWCPTGPLTILPIHAAGHHPHNHTSPTGTETVLDRVISSYTPTLTALARARQTAAPVPAQQLTVGMPTTPGQSPLPAVPAELKVLARHFPPGDAHQQLVKSAATRASVSSAVTNHSWLHLACHARQEQADPDRSGFALWDGILAITDLAALPIQRRDLAFLSACQTATGSVRHIDEAIHLAATMQFLGYRHVIATMWTIADSPAPNVASTFYTSLGSDGSYHPDRSAEALHQAIQALRHTNPASPLLWAPYIHLGP